MKTIRKLILSVLVIFLYSACTSNSKSNHLNDQTDVLNEQIENQVRKYQDLDIFSGVVLVAFDGNISYNKSFGLANRENNIPNTTNTLFDIGSMNKTFTSVMIKQLTI